MDPERLCLSHLLFFAHIFCICSESLTHFTISTLSQSDKNHTINYLAYTCTNYIQVNYKIPQKEKKNSRKKPTQTSLAYTLALA